MTPLPDGMSDNRKTPLKVWLVELAGAAAGALLCGLPGLIYGAPAPPTVFTMAASAVAAAGVALVHPGVRWRTGGGVGFGWAIAVTAQIILDITRDPTSHNLAPFEILIALVFGFPPAALGVILGNLARRHVPRPEAAGPALVALVLAAAVVHARATASDIARAEGVAQRKVEALIAAQYGFRAAHPRRGFTCDLAELGVPFGGPITMNHPSESYRLAGVAYHGGTAAIENEYRFSLKCEVQDTTTWRAREDPQETFVLTANPQAKEWRPLRVFCAGADGTIRSIRRGMMYACFDAGRLVQTVN